MFGSYPARYRIQAALEQLPISGLINKIVHSMKTTSTRRYQTNERVCSNSMKYNLKLVTHEFGNQPVKSSKHMGMIRA